MELKDNLTNEQLKKRFGSQFELVGYAIKLAENMIKSGRDPYIRSESQNAAMHVLEEIEAGVDHFEEIPKQKPAHEIHVEKMTDLKEFKDPVTKPSERKRARKILAD